jgi:hypothetical protein
MLCPICHITQIKNWPEDAGELPEIALYQGDDGFVYELKVCRGCATQIPIPEYPQDMKEDIV